MRSFTLTTTLLVFVLCLVSLPISTVGLQKKLWTKPLELAAGQHPDKGHASLGDFKISWPFSYVSDAKSPSSPPGLLPNIPGLPSLPLLPNIPGFPNLPGLPNLPEIPNIPSLPNFPGLPSLPDLPKIPGLPSLPSLPGLPPLPPVALLQSAKMEKCLTKDGPKTTEKCFNQILSSWRENVFALDKECCEIVVKMDKKCNRRVRMLFKSPFVAPLLQYSCHIKNIKNIKN